MSADRESDSDVEPHPSGLAFVKISLWEDGLTPGNDNPTEAVTVPMHAGDRYAVDGEDAPVEEWINEFLESHIGGECECLAEIDADVPAGDSP